MDKLIAFALKKGVLINIVYVGVVMLASFWAIPNIPIDRYPNIQFGEVTITTEYPGASPEEVERLVTDVIENSLRGMKDIEFVRSTSIANQSAVHVKFIDDTDYDTLYDELRIRILTNQNLLPTVNGDPLAPRFDEITVDAWLPVIQVSLLSADTDAPLPRRALVLLGKELRQRLENLPGVKDVILDGEEPQQFTLAVDPDKLQQLGLTMQDVVGAMRRTGTSPPAGILDTGAGERIIRADLRYRSRDDILQAVVRRDGDGSLLRIADLITHDESQIERIPGSIRTTINGQEAVSAKVRKYGWANAITVKAAVDEAVDAFIAAHPNERILAVPTLDGTVVIADGIGVLTDNLLLSSVLVMVLLFVFLNRRSRMLTAIGMILGSVAAVILAIGPPPALKMFAIFAVAAFVFLTCRAAVLTVSGILFSFLGSLLIFHLLGYSVSEISLLGFVLVTGIVVDDAIVILENIQRQREEGASLHEAVIRGTSQVFWPVTSATLTTMAAFLPMLLMSGAVGEFFSLVPIAVAVALFISLIECLIVLPLHVIEAERLLGKDKNIISEAEQDMHASGQLQRTGKIYDRLLKFNLAHPAMAISGAVLAFLLAVGCLIYSFFAPSIGQKSLINFAFFPDETAVIDISLTMPSGTANDETHAVLKEISAHIMAEYDQDIASVTGLTGMKLDKAYKPVFGNQFGMMNLELPSMQDRGSNANTFIETLRQALTERYIGDIGPDEDPSERMQMEIGARQGGPPTGAPINVRLTGLDERRILAMADDLIDYMRSQSHEGGRMYGVIDLQHDRQQVDTVLAFEPDRTRIAVHGLDDVTVQGFVADAVDGAFVGELRRVDDDIPVRVKLAKGDQPSATDVLDLPMTRGDDGRTLRLTDLGYFTSRQESAQLIKRDFQRTITITGNLSKDSLIGASQVPSMISGWLSDNAAKYSGVTVAFGGEAESTGKSYASLQIAFFFALALIYAILAAQFGSYTQPMLIMSNIVFSLTGVILGLATFGLMHQLLPSVVPIERSTFTVQVFISIVGLTGLVVNDAIVLIDFINQRRREGIPLEQAVVTAGRQRLRPILMTTATTVVGLLPMAIGIPTFSITWGPFATSFIVGLLFSTSMTLLMVPVLYLLLERLRLYLQRIASGIFPGIKAYPSEDQP